MTEQTDWPARFAEAAHADGEDWETLNEKLACDWKDAYRDAWLQIARERGWKRENAETWPHEMQDDAYIHAHEYDYDPARVAGVDVEAAEFEGRTAW